MTDTEMDLGLRLQPNELPNPTQTMNIFKDQTCTIAIDNEANLYIQGDCNNVMIPDAVMTFVQKIKTHFPESLEDIDFSEGD